MSVKIIAEAGVNHNGSLDLAHRLIEEAAKSGADVVKFQTFKADLVASVNADKAEYQKRNLQNTDSQLQMLKKLELKRGWHAELQAACESFGMQFMSTPFDADSLRFLVDDIGLSCLKIPSGELTNGPLLLDFARSGCELILSTGMATQEEVKQALSLMGWGICEPTKIPGGRADFEDAWNDQFVQDALRDRLTVLHCTSQYPAPPETVNLRAMDTLAAEFRLPVGYSDHTCGIAVPIAAVACGATVIEKHFTLDKSMPGPDHLASVEPEELTAMVEAIRTVEYSLGDGVKLPHACELDTANVARRSLIAAQDIIAGEVIRADQLNVRRPGTGLSPMHYWDTLGSVAPNNLKEGELF